MPTLPSPTWVLQPLKASYPGSSSRAEPPRAPIPVGQTDCPTSPAAPSPLLSPSQSKSVIFCSLHADEELCAGFITSLFPGLALLHLFFGVWGYKLGM